MTRKQRNKYAREVIAKARVQQAALRRQQEYDMALAEGIKRGKRAAEDELRVKQQALDTKEHILRAMAQMMDAAARLTDNLHGVM